MIAAIGGTRAGPEYTRREKETKGRTIAEHSDKNSIVSAREAPARGFPPLGWPLLVLVAEDNAPNQLFLKTALRKFGVQCDIAANGQIALEMASEKRYDLILMDCQMPVLDGFAATGEIRKLCVPFRDVPIIALTANSTAEDKARCLQAGMNDFLAKPILLEDLWQMIAAVVSPIPDPAAETARYKESVRLLIGEMRFSTEEARRILDSFFLSVPEFSEQLDCALEAEDSSVLSALAHQMKGISSSLRFREIQATCARLETAVKEGSCGIREAAKALKALLTAYLQAHEREQEQGHD